MTHIRVMQSRPWWFYLGILACAVALTLAYVRHQRYIYLINSTDMIVDTWTGTACDMTTCSRIDAMMDTVHARLPKNAAYPGANP